jgi:hypothetical protein
LRVVHKEDGSIRIPYVNYKPLNKIIEIEQYPLPLVADLYAKIAKAEYFSKIDLKAAYHLVQMHPKSIKYTHKHKSNNSKTLEQVKAHKIKRNRKPTDIYDANHINHA